MSLRSSPTGLLPRSVALLLGALLGVPACGGDWEAPLPAPSMGSGGSGGEPGSSGGEPRDPAPMGLHAVGGSIEDASGNTVVLRGVNRSGSEYSCTKSAGVFDGDVDVMAVQAMASWNLNAVRIPLNEGCWLGADDISPLFSGEIYKTEIKAFVERLQANGMVPILDLHWAAPGDVTAHELWPMPNADHSVEFWRDVALTFLDNDGVIFEPYNEPYPDMNQDTAAAWDCWLDGCQATQWGATESYEAVGMQALVDAIRETGASHLILLGGVEYSNDLSQFLAHLPVDPLGNLGAAWHAYNFNGCVTQACWNAEPGTVAATVPVVATEIGQSDCTGGTFLKPLMNWLDANQLGYLAWSWNTSTTECTPRMGGSEGAPWALVTDYANPEPYSEYAATFRDHLAVPAP